MVPSDFCMMFSPSPCVTREVVSTEASCQRRRNPGLRLDRKRAQHSRQRTSPSVVKDRKESVACTRQMLAEEEARGGARA